MTILDGDWYERIKADNATRGLDVSMCAKVNLDNLAFVAYSSGTTGKPKGVWPAAFRSVKVTGQLTWFRYPSEICSPKIMSSVCEINVG